MDITIPGMLAFDTGVRMTFNEALDAAPSQIGRISLPADSTTGSNTYPRLDELPGMREWIGDRVVHSLSGSSYQIFNRLFEQTVGIKRIDIEDDQYGMFTPAVRDMGSQAKQFPDILGFGLLKRGDTELCYDGQYFFDVDHRNWTSAGVPTIASNVQAGAGPAWFLFCTKRALKPLIFQKRRPFVLTPRVSLDDDNVFFRGEFIWGTDGRMNMGFGLWQLAFMSKAPLTSANLDAAVNAMASLRRPDGSPLGIVPDLMMVPPTLRTDARTLLKAKTGAAGATNIWENFMDLEEVPWLA